MRLPHVQYGRRLPRQSRLRLVSPFAHRYYGETVGEQIVLRRVAMLKHESCPRKIMAAVQPPSATVFRVLAALASVRMILVHPLSMACSAAILVFIERSFSFRRLAPIDHPYIRTVWIQSWRQPDILHSGDSLQDQGVCGYSAGFGFYQAPGHGKVRTLKLSSCLVQKGLCATK